LTATGVDSRERVPTATVTLTGSSGSRLSNPVELTVSARYRVFIPAALRD
jgi:hypothetical protein